MGTSNKVFVSPGVYTSERELSFVAQSVGVTTLGIVGETLKGPAFEPIFITNYDEFRTYFGDTKSERFVNTQIPKYEAAYIAKSYLQQSNQLFVTRILGLSGFDAGPSWSIKTIANVDPETVGINGAVTTYTTGITANTYSSYTFSSISVNLSPLPFASNLTRTFTDNNGIEISLQGSIKSLMAKAVNNSGFTVNDDVFFYGPLDPVDYPGGYTNLVNKFGVSDLDLTTIDLTDSDNNTWYYTLFDPINCSYTGYSFLVYLDTYSTSTPGYITANINFTTQAFTGTCYCEWNNLVLATMRSRGLSISEGPDYEVTGTTDLVMDCSGDYAAVTSNPYAPFALSGITVSGVPFSFEVTMDDNDQNYIPKVIGKGNFDKLKAEVPIFVEEIYPVLLYNGYYNSKIRGLSCDLIPLQSARSGNQYSHGWWLDKYQTPETPWIVSELRGNVVYRLFKCITISDGNAANTEVKVSIANLSYVDGSFDLLVRDFYDTDRNPVVIEKFEKCTMNPSLNNYVAKKVGTSNGEYASLSKYIMLEVNEYAPADTLPCGFEGYVLPTYSGYTSTCPPGGNLPPFPIYKTKINYAGEIIYTPPFGDPIQSLGDKPRRTYLGFSNLIGVDSDLLQYKGKPNNDTCVETNDLVWNYQTKGFHMDSGATVITIADEYVTSGQTAFECGAGDFTSDPQDPNNPYYYLYTRKFSLVFQGGYDGWDIYRQWRTNTDDYQIGKPEYLKGSCPTIRFPQATGTWGAFKVINNDGDIINYANTDYYAYLIGMETFRNPAAVNINVLVTPGIDMFNNLELVKSAIDLVEQDRADSIYIVTMPDWEMYVPTNQNPFDYIFPEEAVDLLEDTEIDSNYTATYYPWVLTRDNVNLTQIYLPPTAEVTRNLALTDNIAFPWFATAGYTRGLVNSVKARKKMSQEDRDILYKGRVNPIATFQDVGTVIWGNKTLQIADGALNRINVRRLLLQARKLISAVAIRLLFEQNDEKLRQDFLDAVNPILDAIRRDRGLVDFRVTVSSSAEDFDKQQLTGKVYLKPTKALEFIDIEFLITPLGASFEDI